jgi:hypothetical protein
MRSACFIFILSIVSFSLLAQQQDDNILITDAKESFRFAEGDKDHPVIVKEQLSTSYICSKYRASLPVVEFYNDELQITDVNARINGNRVRNFKPVYEYYSSNGVFYSDARVCYFTLPLEQKGQTADVTFEETVLDPRYFTSIYFTDQYFIKKKEIEIVVPKWMKIEIKEYNFAGYKISKSNRTDNDADIYTYTIENAAALEKEQQSPGMSYLAPHLLIMSKQASPSGQQIKYFNTLADQYAWYHQLVKQIGNESQTVKQKALELTKDLTSDIEKVKALYVWAQDNIRYIAFEDGIAGFKPEKAQVVLAKKYGDCKGMANLMAEMLKSIGLDGRLCWLGTNHIAHDYSTPSLGVDNHMICAWLYKDQIYYLDATEKYIGFNEIAERIQGRQVLIEDGEKYLLKNIPVATPQQNTSLEKRQLKIEGSDLKGKVTQIWKGENKEWLLTQLHETQKDKQEEILKRFLTDGNSNYQISNLKIFNLNDYNSDLKIEYDLVFKDAVMSVGKEMFLDLDNRKDFSGMSFDTTQRKLPYQFYFKTHILFETDIELPANVKATIPSVLKINNPSYMISGQYKVEKNRLSYQREIQLRNTLLSKNQLAEWNENIARLNDFYNNQLTLSN